MKLRAVLVLSLFSCSAVAQTRGPVDLANAPVPAGARRIAYGTDPLQFGELRVPSTTGPHPVAIVVHGGCWVAKLGSMDERAVAMENMRPVAVALTEAGIATWNVEYPLPPSAFVFRKDSRISCSAAAPRVVSPV